MATGTKSLPLLAMLLLVVCMGAGGDQAAAAADGAAAAQVRLRPHCPVDGDDISLETLADIAGGHSQQRRDMARVVIAAAPLPGHTRIIDADYVAVRLRQSGFAAGTWRLGGADRTAVTRSHQSVTPRQLREIAAAHVGGGGVPWDTFGDEMRRAQGDINRAVHEQLLGPWLGRVPDIRSSLEAGARIADIGCGHGWSSIGLAAAYPGVTVDGYDVDAPSIEAARAHAVEAGVSDRVAFHVADAADPALDDGFDLVFTFEMIHDLPDPAAALANMKRMCAPGGIVVIAASKRKDRDREQRD